MNMPSSRRQFLQTLSLASGALLATPLLSTRSLAQDATASGVVCPPYLQHPAPDRVSVLWATEKPGLSWVEYWPVNDPSQRKVAQDAIYGLRRYKTPKHAVTIRGLKPGTTYAYKVFSREKQKGADVIEPSATPDTRDGTFTTLDPGKDSCRYVVINDMHARGELFAGLLDKAQAEQSDLIFHNGDIVDWLSDEKVVYDKIITPLHRYISAIPFVFIRGNHEYRGGMATAIDNYFPPYREGAYYGLVRQGPVCFVILDTGEDKPDTRTELGGVTDWENYFDQQRGWLEQAVQSPEYKTAKYRVAIHHIPAIGEERFTETKIREQWLSIMAGNGIDLMLNGHTHRNRYQPAGEDSRFPFPVLVNDNKGYVTIKADAKRMLVEHFDKDGGVLHEIDIKPR